MPDEPPLVRQAACKRCSSRIFGGPPSVNGATSTFQAGLPYSRTSPDHTMFITQASHTEWKKLLTFGNPQRLFLPADRRRLASAPSRKNSAPPAACCSEGKHPSLRPIADSISSPFSSMRSHISWSYLAYITAAARLGSPELFLAPLLTPTVKTPYQGGALSK